MEVGVLGAEETGDSADYDLALRAANRVLDTWNADGVAPFALEFNTYLLTAALSPHTIGPTGTWVVTTRPERILNANLVLTTNTPNTKTPIAIMDADWYAGLAAPGLSIAMPTGLWYRPSWPNGSVYFNGKPSTAYSVELETETLLAGLSSLAGSFTLPPGYEKALVLSTAEELQGIYGRQIANLPDRARIARSVVFAANGRAVRISTMDYGMPGDRIARGNWESGWWN